MALTKHRPNTIHPKWPALATLTPETARMSYERQSDTLTMDFGGVVRPAYTHPLDEGDFDYVYLRLDGYTDEVVGLQIEDVLAGFLDNHPEYVAALEHAELHGISGNEVLELQRGVTEKTGGSPSLRDVFEDISRIASTSSRLSSLYVLIERRVAFRG